MSTIPVPQVFAQALHYHQAGRLQEAGDLYRQVLARRPDHADALHYLGLIAHQLGRHDLAVEQIRQALALAPGNPAAHCNLGEACRKLGRLDEAEASFRRALDLKPDFAIAWYNLGILLMNCGRPDEAAAMYHRALQHNPGHAAAHNNLGNLLGRQGRLDEAIPHYRRALDIIPDYAEVHSNLGKALNEQGHFDEAIAHYQKVLHLPFPEAHNNLAVALAGRGRLDEAIAASRRALELRPDYPEAWCNLGLALLERGQVEDAMAAYRRALEIKPGHADAHNNLADAFAGHGRIEEAVEACQRALALDPGHARAKLNYAFLLLLRGDFEKAWPLFEARAEALHYPKRNFIQPRWDGRMLHGQRVLIHAEQGFGDCLHFIRYAPLIAKRGGHVIVECQPSLVELFRSVEGISAVVATGDPLPSFDLHLPILSLPLVFQTTRENIPCEVPYLFANPARQEIWREKISGDPTRRRVGLAWAGQPRTLRLQERHLTLPQLLPLLRVEGVDFFSLQMENGTDQLRQFPPALNVIDLTPQIRDFADTAALMMELDLIISVDTSVAHLAGALGRPVWTLLPSVPDWRWGLEAETNPWYPTMRLFRQRKAGDWEEALALVASALHSEPLRL